MQLKETLQFGNRLFKTAVVLNKNKMAYHLFCLRKKCLHTMICILASSKTTFRFSF